MAGLGDLLQRVARSLEEAQAQRPADDLRARLGYGTGDDDDELDSDSIWEPETERDAETAQESGTAREPEAAGRPWATRRSEAARRSETARTPRAAGRPESPRAPAPGTLRTSVTHRTPPPGNVPGGRPSSPAAPSYPRASSAFLFPERIRARLGTPDALREAFVVKEILDRPLGRRRRR